MSFEAAPALPGWLAAELTVSRRAFRLQRGPDAGRCLHFIDDGDRKAPAVVMLHGNPTWSFLWRKVIAALPEDAFRCVAPDLLGLGLSDKLPASEPHSLDRHADAIAELLEALALPRFVLVGQDWGGPICAALGVRMPERVAGLVLANTSVQAPKRPRGTWFHRFARVPVISDLAFRGLGVPQIWLGGVQGDRTSLAPHSVASRAYRWPLRRLRDRAAPLAMARMVPDAPDHPSLEPLRRGESWASALTQPVALVWGTRDPILGRALRRHERMFPTAPVTLTRAGHFLQEEVPEALAAAIEDVWQRAGADPETVGTTTPPRAG